MRWSVYIILLATLSTTIMASPLDDPGVPDGEVARYRIEQEDEVWSFTERTTRVVERGIDSYRFEYLAPNERSEVFVDRDGMLPFSVRNSSNGGSITISSTTDIELGTRVVYEAIMVLSFSELKYLLRGFPFGETRDLGVAFFSTDDDEAEDERFTVSVRYEGKDTIRLEERQIETHKLELKFSASGILRVLNALVGKTVFWYSVDPPHYLVAYEGTSSFPGSPRQTITIVDYSGW